MDEKRIKDIFLARVDNYIGEFSQRVIKDFCDYWLTKVMYKGEEMYRFQTQFTFDFRRRLKYWERKGLPGKYGRPTVPLKKNVKPIGAMR